MGGVGAINNDQDSNQLVWHLSDPPDLISRVKLIRSTKQNACLVSILAMALLSSLMAAIPFPSI